MSEKAFFEQKYKQNHCVSVMVHTAKFKWF